MRKKAWRGKGYILMNFSGTLAAAARAEFFLKPAAPAERGMRRYLAAALAAAVLSVAFMAVESGARPLAAAAVAFVAGMAAQVVFAAVRGRSPGGGALVFGLLLALMLPPSTPLWAVAVGAAFAMIFAQEAFGGLNGRIFNPALVGKAFLAFSYPHLTGGTYFGSMLGAENADAWVGAALLALAAGAAMVAADRANLRILLAVAAAGAATAFSLKLAGRLPYSTILEALLSDGFLFGACFLACDPASAPRSLAGKWLYGLLIGALAIVMRTFSIYTEAMMCALLIGAIFSPTIDIAAGEAGKPRA